MKEDRIPIRTSSCTGSLAGLEHLDLMTRVLLACVDGRRNLVELESVARALGFHADALTRLEARGLMQIADGARPSRLQPEHSLPASTQMFLPDMSIAGKNARWLHAALEEPHSFE